MIHDLRTETNVYQALRVVLACGEEARAQRQQLSPVIARCATGPFERTAWLDAIAKNLGSDGPVRLVRGSPTQNFLEIEMAEGSVRCALYFAQIANGAYRVHSKGPEREQAPEVQLSLFPDAPLGLATRQYAYALLVPSTGEDEVRGLELHILYGPQPNEGAGWKAEIPVTSQVLVVRLARERALEPGLEVHFVPDDVRR